MPFHEEDGQCSTVHGGYLIEDGQKQDREWNTNYLDLQFVIHMSDFYDQLADGR